MKGNGGRKVSPPKQLAVALVYTSVNNTTVYKLKLAFKAHSVAIPGVSGCYADQYITTAGKQQIIRFYSSLGKKLPSVSVPIPSCQPAH